MNNKFQKNIHKLGLQIAKFENIDYRCGGCCLTNDMVDIKFRMVQVFLMLVINP